MLYYAAEAGHLEVVKFLVENGGKISDYAVYFAAGAGHLEVAKFLEENFKENTYEKPLEEFTNDHAYLTGNSEDILNQEIYQNFIVDE